MWVSFPITTSFCRHSKDRRQTLQIALVTQWDSGDPTSAAAAEDISRARCDLGCLGSREQIWGLKDITFSPLSSPISSYEAPRNPHMTEPDARNQQSREETSYLKDIGV